MYTLIYASDALPGIDVYQVKALVKKAQTWNKQREITGVLFFGQARFAQVLEGDRENVCRLFHIIMNDDRHSNVQILSAGESSERRFPEWSMRLIRWEEQMPLNIKQICVDIIGTDTFDPFEISPLRLMKLAQELPVER